MWFLKCYFEFKLINTPQTDHSTNNPNPNWICLEPIAFGSWFLVLSSSFYPLFFKKYLSLIHVITSHSPREAGASFTDHEP